MQKILFFIEKSNKIPKVPSSDEYYRLLSIDFILTVADHMFRFILSFLKAFDHEYQSIGQYWDTAIK